jgi:hypothetical protein
MTVTTLLSGRLYGGVGGSVYGIVLGSIPFWCLVGGGGPWTASAHLYDESERGVRCELCVVSWVVGHLPCSGRLY